MESGWVGLSLFHNCPCPDAGPDRTCTLALSTERVRRRLPANNHPHPTPTRRCLLESTAAGGLCHERNRRHMQEQRREWDAGMQACRRRRIRRKRQQRHPGATDSVEAARRQSLLRRRAREVCGASALQWRAGRGRASACARVQGIVMCLATDTAVDATPSTC